MDKKQRKNLFHHIDWLSLIEVFLIIFLLVTAAFIVILLRNSISNPANFTNEGAYNNNALTLLTLIIAIWAGLNIYNVINNQSVIEINKKYQELNKQIRWFFFLEKVKQASWGDLSKLLPYSLDEENNLREDLIEYLIDIAEKFLNCKWEFEHCMNRICIKHCNELLQKINENKDFNKIPSLRTYLRIIVFSLCTYTERNKLRKNKSKDIDTAELEKYISQYLEIYQDYSKYTNDDLCQYMCLMIAYMKQILFEARNENNDKECQEIEKWYIKSISTPHPKSQCLQYYGIFLEKCKHKLIEAKCKYEQALKAGDCDSKIYNLIGSLYLKLFEEENDVPTRFDEENKLLIKRKYISKGLLAERKYFDKNGLIDKALSMLEVGKCAMPELTDIYANLSKGYMYKWLLNPKENASFNSKAYEMISVAKNLPSNERIVMFTERNLYEANKDYRKAMAKNAEIRKQLGDYGDVILAHRQYLKYVHKRL